MNVLSKHVLIIQFLIILSLGCVLAHLVNTTPVEHKIEQNTVKIQPEK